MTRNARCCVLRPVLVGSLVLWMAWSAVSPRLGADADRGASRREVATLRSCGKVSLRSCFRVAGSASRIMMFLIALSVTAVYLMIDHLLTIRRSDIMPEGLSDHVRELLAAGQLAEADLACRAKPSFLSFVLIQGLAEVEGGWSAVEKALEDATAEQSARLFRKLEYLSVLANIAPMVGLLGTVVGMIMAFKQVAETQGSAGAGDLAEGIYTALVTTVAGLLIAIPSLGAFAIFRSRVDQFVAEAAYLALHAFAPLKRRRVPAKTQNAPPPPPAREGR